MFTNVVLRNVRRSRASVTGLRVGLMALLVALLLTMGLGPAAQAQSVAPEGPMPASPPYSPVLLVGDGGSGSIYIGAIPPGSYNKPVLVFVAGKGGKAQDWWQDTTFNGHNDMYDYAYNYGYRTAFVSLVDANGRYWGGSMWENGEILAGQINWITSYFSVSTVNIVAHSKGGIDTQAAIVHYGAYPKVQKVMTLSSPHYGTQLADLAYGSGAWWLGMLIGELNNASFVMQTGYMSWFRSITDGRGENTWERYYTANGRDWGPFPLWLGGSFLSPWGDNDGMVTVANSQLPWWYSQQVRTAYQNHDNIRMGVRSFDIINAYVGTNWRAGMAAPQPGPSAPTTTADPNAHVAAGSIVRGGSIAAHSTAADQIMVEPGATHVTFDVLSNAADLALTWTAPNGRQYTAKPVAAGADEMFSSAYHYQVDVDAPAAGAWQLSLANPAAQPAAYLAVANLSSPVTVAFDRDATATFAPGSRLPFKVSVADAKGRSVSKLQITSTLRLSGGAPQTASLQAGASMANNAVTLPSTAGVANYTFTVTGQLSDGSAFERTVITSVPVVANGQTLPVPANAAGAATR